MKQSITEMAAAWIVAAALIAAMAFNVLIPTPPPAFGRGVTSLGPARPALDLPTVSKSTDGDLPLIEFGGPFGPSTDDDKAVAEPRRSGSGSHLTRESLSGHAR